MPRYDREQPEEAPDYRPAFNRPPGATKVSPTPKASPSTPKRSSKEKEKAKQSPAVTPQKKSGNSGARRKSSAPAKATPTKDRAKYNSSTSSGTHSHGLSVDSLAKLDQLNAKTAAKDKVAARKKKEKQYKNVRAAGGAQTTRRKKNRNVSGALLEEGRWNEKNAHIRKRGGAGSVREYVTRRRTADGSGSSNRKCWWALAIVTMLLIIFIPVGVVLSKKKTTSSSTNLSSGSANGTNLPAESSIPVAAQGTVLDPYTWYDTTDFNTTYTNDTVGGLSVMGLFSSWDDSASANSNTPPLSSSWKYGQTPIRGVNLGGWLSIEPFITPSLFNTYTAADNVVDEYTLSDTLGASAAGVIEKHYATFITEQDFADIANAGLDHVRIPYPYWAVTTYPGDPYVPKIAWRYLLRGIEYARKYGLRVNLDLHALPGSQNGWNHSGRQGSINWISGSDGALNAQRSLDIHNQLSQFFAQERYNNVVTLYGLVNEPRMLVIPIASVIDWNTQAVKIVRGNGMKQHIPFGDGFLALNQWDQMFKNVDSGLVMDTHQYEIFSAGGLNRTHQDKINSACSDWSTLISTANNPSTGWGPIIDGEWSQADTDCATYINNVNVGSRWSGTLNYGDGNTGNILTQSCPTPPCSCTDANADYSQYSDIYKQFLQTFAEAQMHSFEQGWGWFYWTWATESAVQWSWKLGLQAGILPTKAYSPSFKCGSTVPDFAASGLPESY